MQWLRPRSAWLPLLAALTPLLLIYLLTLQVIPNGSSHYFMIDAGEAQIVLNEWGSLHPTGYPLYVFSGNLLTGVLRALGVSPLAAPALVSLIWGLLALSLLFAVGLRLGLSPWLVAAGVLLFGLTRTAWIHNVIAEIYSFNLFLLLLLLSLALAPAPSTGRIFLLALVGGIALAHHRAFLTLIPPLLCAVWPALRRAGRDLPRILLICSLLGALGFLQYLWPLLRARAGAAWVYGEPSTLPALLDLILANEYGRFIGPPETFADLSANLSQVNGVLSSELSIPGIILGIAGLLLALRSRRRPALTLILTALCAWLFHVFLYRDILSALILPVTLSLVFGWLFLADAALKALSGRRAAGPLVALVALSAMALLLRHNHPFIRQLTADSTGLETVSAIERAPPGHTVMLAWGPRYFAASAAQLYLDRLEHITLVDHNGDHRAPFLDGKLITPDYSFFAHPLAWWEARLGQRVWLEAAGPRLVRLRPQPVVAAGGPDGPAPYGFFWECDRDALTLGVLWYAGRNAPTEDFSVFVKAFDAEGELLAQGDQHAPVYGLRPTSGWLAGEKLRDHYPLPVHPDEVAEVTFGLYRVNARGEFENVFEMQMVDPCS